MNEPIVVLEGLQKTALGLQGSISFLTWPCIHKETLFKYAWSFSIESRLFGLDNDI